jgi:pyrroline-5-carboxylate reductase
MNSIAFIGAGNMAAAMIEGLLSKKLISADKITCLGGAGISAQKLADKTGVKRVTTADELLASADTLVVAFKPQHLAQTNNTYTETTKGLLVVSVLAGKRLETLSSIFPQARNIVRCMPNTPGKIGAGITGWCSKATLTTSDHQIVTALLGALGKTVEVSENQMDALTGVSGSGPAYVFEFAAALRDAGIKAGLNAETANTLAVETLLGAAKLLASENKPAEILRDQVTSPNGTTFAGLNRLKEGNFRELIAATVQAAKARSEELSKS